MADRIALPPKIHAHLTDRINRVWAEPSGRERAIAGLPAVVEAGEVGRLISGGPFGWMVDGRLDAIDGQLALEALENDRMSGPSHYRVWDDGTVEELPSPQTGYALPRDCSPEEEQRIKDEYYAHNRRVGTLLRERGFNG